MQRETRERERERERERTDADTMQIGKHTHETGARDIETDTHVRTHAPFQP